MRRSTAFIALLGALLGGMAAGCTGEGMTCRYELACANQDGLIGTCCVEEPDGRWSCYYEAPDGTRFDCESIEDPISAVPYCEQAVEDLTAHCSE